MPYKDPEKARECKRQSAQRRRDRDPHGVREINRRSYAKNREERLEAKRRYREENRGRLLRVQREESRRRRKDPAYRSQMMRYQTLYYARRKLEAARKQAEELYNG